MSLISGRRVRGRQYPWGFVEVDNPKHSDFALLRSSSSHVFTNSETTNLRFFFHKIVFFFYKVDVFHRDQKCQYKCSPLKNETLNWLCKKFVNQGFVKTCDELIT